MPGIAGFDLLSTSDRAFAFDWDGSGRLDHIALYRPGQRKFWMARNDGGVFTSVFTSSNGVGTWDLASAADRAFAFDWEGDGTLNDLVLYRPGGHALFVLKRDPSVAYQFTSVFETQTGVDGFDLGSPGDQAFAFDWDGTGKLDHIALYRPGTGHCAIVKHDGAGFTQVYASEQGFGPFDLTSPTDRVFAFNWDGPAGSLAHLACYRPGGGRLTILGRSGGTFSAVCDCRKGVDGSDLMSPADTAFAYDHDGSGKLDHIVLTRPGTGACCILTRARSDRSQASPSADHGHHPETNALLGTAAAGGGVAVAAPSAPSAGSLASVYKQPPDGQGIGGFDLRGASDSGFAFAYGGGSPDHLAFYRPGGGALVVLEHGADGFHPPLSGEPAVDELVAPGVNGRPVPGAAAVFDKKLWLIGSGNIAYGTEGYAGVYCTTFTLPSGIKETTKDGSKPLSFEEAVQRADWKSARVPIHRAQTVARGGLAAGADSLLFFWNQPIGLPWNAGGEVHASRNSLTGKGALAWSEPLRLLAKDGQHPLACATAQGEVSAAYLGKITRRDATVGSDVIVVTACGVKSWWHNGDPALYIGTFNLADLDTYTNTWPAQSETWLTKGDLQRALPRVTGVGTRVSADWFNSGGGPDSSTPFMVWASLYPDKADRATTVLFGMDFQGTLTPSPVTTPAFADAVPHRAACSVIRDPGGRLLTYSTDSREKQIIVGAQNTSGLPNPSVVPLNAIFTTRPAPSVDSVPPTVLFYTDVDAATEVQADPDDPESASGSAYPVYEFVFYNGGKVRCQVQRYGTAQSFPQFDTLRPEPDYSDVLVAGGLIDGPIPIPAINLGPETSADSLGTVTYGSQEHREDGHQVEQTWSAGFKSEGAWKIGPAWEISFSAGQGYVDGSRIEVTVATECDASSDIDSTTKKLIADARLFGNPATIEVTAYRFLDRAGKAIVDGTSPDGPNQALVFTRTTAVYSNTEYRYTPYYFDAGELESYTPESLNARMAKLLSGDDHIAAAARDVAGHDYFKNVIDENGYPFDAQRHYLGYSAGSGGKSVTRPDISQTDFTEHSWQTELSVYAGFHGEWGAGEATVLAGGSYSYKSNTSHTTTKGWGIHIDSFKAPAATSDPRSVSDYDFRLYFLPPPAPKSKLPANYWAWELQHCLGQAPPTDPVHLTAARIDPFAQPWRIMFVVTRILYKDGTTYLYNG